MAHPAPPAAVSSTLTSQVDLFVSCNNLPSLDVLSKSDPFCVAYLIDAGNASHAVGRTEVIKDNENPAFATAMRVDYHFEEVQKVLVQVWDFDGGSSHDYIGDVCVNLAQIVGARSSTLKLPLVRRSGPQSEPITYSGDPARAPTVTITAAEVKSTGGNDLFRFQLSCKGLDKKDLFGSSDPFIVVNRLRTDGTRFPVWKSGVVKNNLNPVFEPSDVLVSTLCGGDLNAPLAVEVIDWNKSGKHEPIGEAALTVGMLLTPPGPTGPPAFPVINAEKASKKKSYTNSGSIVPLQAQIVKRPTFLDYLRGGLEMNVIVGIDFTGSNGDPRQPGTLHYVNPANPSNEYLAAISSVCRILLDYDHDGNVPVYGFGGSVSGAPVSHCFPLTFNEAAPEVHGLEGILGVYQHAFSYVTLSGPTLFAPIINRAAEIAAAGAHTGKYSVLLLITDGQMNDTDAAVRAIVDASHAAPLSIIIVGVGGADFSAMEFLDGDDARLSYPGRVAARDIVQFVPFRRFVAETRSTSFRGAGTALAREVLHELPGQVVEHYCSRGVLPGPVAPAASVGPAGMSGGSAPPAMAYPPAGGAVAVPLPY